ncbi:hypothetical protein LN042_35150 [Kitasatospora sp. RB6PN24]|uniref:hypothetical protein n=1 Tax=Kitasatospora humi TaxID=2893891 RepID=UPI001E528F82|nr:hypothetical protein [Kitasatospora humi]MCC9312241.1 hypothetical protein [Kitasatospora humi]
MRKTLPLLVAAIVLGLGGGLVVANGGASAAPAVQQSDTTGVTSAHNAVPMGNSGQCC